MLKKRFLLMLFLLTSCTTLVLAQGVMISGIVSESNGSSIPGVTVYEKGITTGTITDMNLPIPLEERSAHPGVGDGDCPPAGYYANNNSPVPFISYVEVLFIRAEYEFKLRTGYPELDPAAIADRRRAITTPVPLPHVRKDLQRGKYAGRSDNFHYGLVG